MAKVHYIRKAQVQYHGRGCHQSLTIVGRNHSECFKKAATLFEDKDISIKIENYRLTPLQGFLTNKGSLISRGAAFVIAKKADQIFTKHSPVGCLLAEDMIWDEHEDSFLYSINKIVKKEK